MKKNIGKADRLMRLGIAILLLALGIYKQSWIMIALSVFVFFEAIASWCLLYQIIGKNTCSGSRKN